MVFFLQTLHAVSSEKANKRQEFLVDDRVLGWLITGGGRLVNRGRGWQGREMGAKKMNPNSSSNAKKRERELETVGGNGEGNLILQIAFRRLLFHPWVHRPLGYV